MKLPIRQRISALTCLKAGPKAVLMEVCELHENGGRGCFASNDALSKKLGVSLATVTRTVASLTAWGLLVARVVPAEANRRYLVPTPAVRACYVGGGEVQQLDAVANLTIVKSKAETELTIVKNDTDYSQNSELTIVKNDVDYSQNASRVYGDDQDDHKTTNDDQGALRAALAEVEELKKKCGLLEEELTALKTQRPASQTEGAAADVPTLVEAPAQPRPHGYDPEAIADNLRLPFATPAFRAAWVGWRAYREQMKYRRLSGGMMEQTQLDKLELLSGKQEPHALALISQAIGKGWQDFYPLDKPFTSHDSPHQHRPTTFQRPAQAARFGDARQPIAEGIQQGPVLTGKLSDL